MKNILRKLIRWALKDELDDLKSEIAKSKQVTRKCELYEANLKSMLQNIDVSVDVHESHHRYSPSWAVVSLQGERTDFIKFINLRDQDIREIDVFLRQFDRINNVKIDAAPNISAFLKVERRNRKH